MCCWRIYEMHWTTSTYWLGSIVIVHWILCIRGQHIITFMVETHFTRRKFFHTSRTLRLRNCDPCWVNAQKKFNTFVNYIILVRHYPKPPWGHSDMASCDPESLGTHVYVKEFIIAIEVGSRVWCELRFHMFFTYYMGMKWTCPLPILAAIVKLRLILW